MQDKWLETVYIVTVKVDQEGSVYRAVPKNDAGEGMVLHRMHL